MRLAFRAVWVAFALVVALPASDGTAAAPSSGPKNPICASSHGFYADPDAFDEFGECLVSLSNQDYTTAMEAIQNFYGVCTDEALWLYNSANWQEWTGWYETTYFWDAFTDGQTVGIHWDHVGNAWLWAHEGAHGLGVWNEAQADARADYCMQVPG